jgi:hypothetical protein
MQEIRVVDIGLMLLKVFEDLYDIDLVNALNPVLQFI